MTYHEKELDRIISRVSKACDITAITGGIMALWGIMAGMYECFAYEPYSPVTIALSMAGIALILAALAIGNQINRK